MRLYLSAFSSMFAVAGLAAGEVRPAKIFADHMVLQQDLPASVWGWAKPGAVVSVEFAGQSVKATAGVLTTGTLEGAGIWLRVGIVYDIVFFVVAAMLFEPLIED